VLGGILAACGSRESGPLRNYASGTLTPGQGLNDIHLGDPIGPFLERFGSGRVSVSVGDELLAADLHFPEQGLSFRFTAGTECQSAIHASGSAVQAMTGLRDAKRFLTTFPACGSMPLQSIGVEDSGDMSGPSFAGQTAKGSRLRMTRAELFEHDGAGVADPSVSSVLESAQDGQFEQFVFPGGLVAYVKMSGKDSHEASAADWKVVKMAVVPEFH